MSAVPDRRLDSAAGTLSPAKEALLARLIRNAGSDGGPRGAEGGSRDSAIPRGSTIPRGPAIPRRDGEPWAPLSFAQLRLWFLERLAPKSATYNIPLALRLVGPLDEAALEHSLQAIVDRHSVLSSAIAARGAEPMQRPVAGLRLALEREVTVPGDRAALDAAIRAEVRRPFTLIEPPLIRARLLRSDASEHVLVMTWHHAIADEWSGAIFASELAALYAAELDGRPVALPALPVSYGEYARWEREHLRGATLERELSHWRTALDGAPAALDLPTDRPRPAVQAPEGDVLPFRLRARTVERQSALARELGATPFMVSLAAFAGFLHRLSGQDDVVVGSPIAGRTRPEVEGLIGFFANTIALRARVDGKNSFRALVESVRDTTSTAYAHQELPFDRVVEELAPERDLSRHPIFQTLFSWHDEPASELALRGLRVSRLDVHTGTAKFDLSLFLHRDEHGAEGVLEYATALFDRATAERLASGYVAFLDAAVADGDRPVGELPLMSAADRRTVVADWNRTAEPIPAGRVEHRVAAQVQRTPEAVAVRHGGRTLTYAELDALANRLAHRLRSLGVGPGDLVGVCLERAAELPSALLGVLKSGAAYVPLDPTHPDGRLAFILDDAAPRVVVCQRHLAARFAGGPAAVLAIDDPVLGHEREDPPATIGGAHDLAYVMYTSGSTGRPKGVAVEHAAVVNLLAYTRSLPGIVPEDRVLAVSTFGFDISLYELLAPLTVGAVVILASEEEVRDGAALLARLREEGATIVDATPATWRMLIAAGWDGGEGVKAISTGEALAPGLAAELAARADETWNLYGPTEATVWAAWHRVAGDEQPMPIGRPVPNARLYVVDAGLQPVPPGIPGELYIGGNGLARGYHRRPSLTAERFVPDPFGSAGGRLYRTGDLARYRPDGTLDYLGRLDHQVKLRGHRIELGEIEATLRDHAAIREAVVGLEGAGDDARLVAYVVPRSDPVDVAANPVDAAANPATAAANPVDAAELRGHLAERLPPVMVPTRVKAVAGMPLNANGKVDRAALAQLEAPAEAAAAPRTAPLGSGTEGVIAAVWRETLGVEAVGPDDRFFELGGHSLLALRVVQELSLRLDREIPVVALFQYPTVRAFARFLETKTEVQAR